MTSKIGIVGSGLIGKCWAMLFARAGFTVVLYDIDASALQAALEPIKAQIAGLQEMDMLNGQTVEEVHARISTTTSLADCVKDAIHVQECVPETVEHKQRIFAQLDEVADDSVVLASSTSCIAASKFSEGLDHRAQIMVAHPVNPPQFIPLVELVPSPWTHPDVVIRTRDLMKKIGQRPITLKKEVNGFVLNRLQYALLMEAWRLVEDDVADVADVDDAVCCGLGLRWSFIGPFQTIHLNAPNGVVDYCDRYGENITTVCAEQASSRQMKASPTAQKIHDEMCKTVPLDHLAEQRQWRDRRLALLAAHKKQQDEKEHTEASNS